MAFSVGRCGIDLIGADGLHARGHRLEEPATQLAAAKRGLSKSAALAFWGVTTHPICDSLHRMDADRNAGPDDIAAQKEALAVERAKALEIAAELAVARAKASED